MTSRERILAVLKGKKADRVPWIPLCSWDYFKSTPHHKAGSDWMDPESQKIRIDFFHQIGADYMQWCAFPYYATEYGQLVLRTKPSARVKKKIIQKGNFIRTEYRTPVGSLTADAVYSEIGHTTYNQKDLLKTEEDLKIFRYIIENISCTPDHEGLSKHLEIVDQEGVLFIAAPPPPLKSFLLGVMRLQNAVFMIYDHKHQFDKLIRVVDEKNQEIYHIIAESPAEVIIDAGVVGLGMISPQIFREYYLPFTKKYAEILHKAGKLYINHTSGEPIGNLLDSIKESNIDGLYGLDYPPSTDTKISEVRNAFKGKVAVMGGIYSDFIAFKSVHEIQEKVREILTDMVPGDHFLLGTADDTPYGTPPKNLKAVSEVVQQRG
jgi:hypothetical protein